MRNDPTWHMERLDKTLNQHMSDGLRVEKHANGQTENDNIQKYKKIP